MKVIKKMSYFIVLLFISGISIGCSSPLNIKYNPLENPDNHLASILPVKIKLADFVDKRDNTQDATLIGEKRTGVQVGRFDVRSAQPVNEIFRDAMKAELIRSGHTVVDENENILIKGELKYFWLKINVNSEDGSTVSDWDVIAEIKIFLEVVNISTGKSGMLGPYYAKSSEKRFLEPDDTVMQRVFESSLSELMKSINSDTKLATALYK
jgi:hypothetical protein